MKKIEFINNNKSLVNLILYPLLAVFCINLLFFIVSSVFDLEIMKIFEDALEIKFFRFLSIFYLEAGYTELYIVFALLALIFCEYICNFYQNKKGIKTNTWIWTLFGIILSIWFAFEILKYLPKLTSQEYIYDKNTGEAIYSLKSLLKPWEYKGTLIFIIIYQLIVLLAVLFYVRLFFVKKNNFYEKQYWKEGITVLVYFFVAYGLIGTLKVLMGRNYYNTMESALNTRIEMSGMDIELLDEWIKTPEYQPWWTFNGLIGNPDKINWSLSQLFNGNAFPSGHLAASGFVGMAFIFILNPKNQSLNNTWSVNKTKALAVYVFIAHCFMMQITFLINGSHWLSDTSFSFMWIIASIFITIKITNLAIKFFEKRYENKLINKKNQ